MFGDDSLMSSFCGANLSEAANKIDPSVCALVPK